MTTDKMTLITTKQFGENTFSFFASVIRGRMTIVVRQFTDFSNSILAEDFPNGSTMHWHKSFPKSVSMQDAVNIVGKGLLKEWSNISLAA